MRKKLHYIKFKTLLIIVLASRGLFSLLILTRWRNVVAASSIARSSTIFVASSMNQFRVNRTTQKVLFKLNTCFKI